MCKLNKPNENRLVASASPHRLQNPSMIRGRRFAAYVLRSWFTARKGLQSGLWKKRSLSRTVIIFVDIMHELPV